ncbi:unnamed protein product [Vitrella brassicaformis CCMP3155]|uniref:Coenzyme PQQ synthesis protein F-like C-terminal lobe domain-containing protein n=1 Tax=Vitrella brassicaformis (strain CCMP3155) TaxID=1169540 RepID=A0A0G4EXX0_VITBC|nr:unnamed protein product [Vitrella brassicaformis CCMP3155]|eukprot:CEM03566.1 unnamed protein product [Vitrella brassicaformis CCMP3155]
MLRLEQNLCYHILASSCDNYGVRGVSLYLQSTDHGPADVEQHVETWLGRFRRELKDMSPQAFKDYLEGYTTNARQLETLMSAEVISRAFLFNRDEEAMNALQKITKSMVLEFVDKYMAFDAPHRRKAVSFIWGTHLQKEHQQFVENQRNQGFTVLQSSDEVEAFRAGLERWPPRPSAHPEWTAQTQTLRKGGQAQTATKRGTRRSAGEGETAAKVKREEPAETPGGRRTARGRRTQPSRSISRMEVT